ncbi:MAG: GNAT family N-acetyltransferase [Verrucomicrobiota bacterium JB023]|nr:GNAT family N-acetyltransferase [Verrucomicrobiota bacterium JB023]
MKEEVVLGDGSRGLIRSLTPQDREALVAGFASLSPESRIRRFFFDKKKLSDEELHRLTHPDGVNHLALGMEVQVEEKGTCLPVGVARCFRDQSNRAQAEVALVTHDDWQGLGVGTALTRCLAGVAWEAGIRRWNAAIFCQNKTVLNLLSRVGLLTEERVIGSGVMEVICELDPPVRRLGS